MILFKALTCAVKGHDFVGVKCARCAKAWGWKVRHLSALETQERVDRDLKRLAGGRW